MCTVKYLYAQRITRLSFLPWYHTSNGQLLMNQADFLRAKKLSQQLAQYGKLKPKTTVKPKKGLIFPYKALQVTPPDGSATARLAQKDAARSAQQAAELAQMLPNIIARLEKTERLAETAARVAVAPNTTEVEPKTIEKTIETVVERVVEEKPFELTQDVVKQIVQLMHKLPEKDKLEVSQGIRNAQSFIYGGTKYQVSEMMHGGGGNTSSSGYQNPTVGVVNGVNQVYTWATAPSVIVVDQGRPMQKVSSDGTVNWTGTTTTTLAIAPNFDIFATA